jgi:phosphatidyl-myo-inositol alpha-mannosyltransferase
MKVALFHATLPEQGRKLGGVEIAVHRLANALAATEGIDVKVYSLSDAPAGAMYQHRRLYARLPWLRKNHLARVLILPFLLNFVLFDTSNVMHFHGDDWFFLRRRVPTVRTFHGSALFEARAAGWSRKVEWYCVYLFEILARRLCRVSIAIGRSTAVIYGSAHLMDNGVDTKLFRPGVKTKHPQIIYIGAWEGRKRGRFLFDLFVREILPAFPDARLCMVADYCPEHHGVVVRRFPSDEDLARYLRESWVFAYPSLYEGFGIAYLEALASGTAVLTSPNEGARHVLQEGLYGSIAEDAHFANRLQELLASEKERSEYARVGRERAAQFSWEGIAARHKAIYREALRS